MNSTLPTSAKSSRSTVLWLFPTAGLCNRMRSLDSAVHFARTQRADLRVIWILDSELNCRFERLFEPISAVRRLYTFSCTTRRGQLYKKLFQRFRITPWTESVVSAEEHFKMEKDNVRTESLLCGRSICLTSWDRFYIGDRAFADFKPVAPLLEVIERQTQNFSRTVGVHIRRTDHLAAISNSSTARFIDAMARELAIDSRTTFFLSTDSPLEEEQLKTIFPGRILSYQKRSLDRRSPLAIEDALIDVYCLSRTTKILGSHTSSFTETAGALGEIDVTYIR